MIEPDPRAFFAPVEEDITELEREERGAFTLGAFHDIDVRLRARSPQGHIASRLGFASVPQSETSTEKTGKVGVIVTIPCIGPAHSDFSWSECDCRVHSVTGPHDERSVSP